MRAPDDHNPARLKIGDKLRIKYMIATKIEAEIQGDNVMRSIDRQLADDLIAAEIGQYKIARREGSLEAAWTALERVHVIGQPFFTFHLSSHGRMLGFALTLGDWREVIGQMLRLALVPLGSLTGRLPEGNTGRARISAFRSMPISPELAEILASRNRSTTQR